MVATHMCMRCHNDARTSIALNCRLQSIIHSDQHIVLLLPRIMPHDLSHSAYHCANTNVGIYIILKQNSAHICYLQPADVTAPFGNILSLFHIQNNIPVSYLAYLEYPSFISETIKATNISNTSPEYYIHHNKTPS